MQLPWLPPQPRFTDEGPDGGLARSQNLSEVTWLGNIQAALGQTSQTLRSGLFSVPYPVCVAAGWGHWEASRFPSLLREAPPSGGPCPTACVCVGRLVAPSPQEERVIRRRGPGSLLLAFLEQQGCLRHGEADGGAVALAEGKGRASPARSVARGASGLVGPVCGPRACESVPGPPPPGVCTGAAVGQHAAARLRLRFGCLEPRHRTAQAGEADVGV